MLVDERISRFRLPGMSTPRKSDVSYRYPVSISLPCLCGNQTDKLLSNQPHQGQSLGLFTMGNHFVKFTDTKSLEEMANRSKERPVVIFKHSLTCAISAGAYDQMAEFEGEVALIEVQRARELSSEIENRLGVAHESPQVIVLRNGQVVWNASHFKITVDAVAEAVRGASAEGRSSSQAEQILTD
jgi:bacillithiol system protein YtxJ